MIRLTDFAKPVLRKRKESTWFQDPKGFAEEDAAIGNVHRNMLGVAAVECFVGIGKLLPVAVSDRDRTLHPNERG